MAAIRQIDWTAAMHAVAADRAKRPAGLLAARSLIEATSAKSRPLVVIGAYDRAAIMSAAVAAAKAHQARTGAAWGEAMSVALKAAWQAAKRARGAASH